MILLKIIQGLYSREISHTRTACKICENLVYLSKAFAQNDKDLPSNPHDLVEKFSCDSSKRKCMYTYKCDVCNVCICADNFERFNECYFYNWQKVDGKVRKTCLTASHRELFNMFNTQMPVLKKHIFVKREQNTLYNNVKDNLEEKITLKCLLTLSIGRTIATKINKKSKVPTLDIIHFQYSWPVAVCGDDGEVVSKNITVTSNATDNSLIAAHTCNMKVIEELNKTVQIAKVHVWSDGCAAQFHSQYVFDLIA